MAKKSKNKEQTTDAEYIRLGKMLANLLETHYPSAKRFYIVTFIRGILLGLGSAIGATIVLAAVIWALSLFETIPFLEPVINRIQQSLQSAGVVINRL